MNEDDIHLFIKQYTSHFITYEISTGIYSIKDVSDAVYTMGDHEGTIEIDYDDIIVKTKLILTRFGLTFGVLRFDGQFFSTLVGFTPYCDYKPTNAIHADSPGVYTSEKILSFCTLDKIHLKCDVIDGSVVNRIRESILLSFVLDKLPECKVFYQPETFLYKKINKSVLNTITFFWMIIRKNLISIKKRWLLHCNWSKSELLNELSKF